jgi:hypothetical protein
LTRGTWRGLLALMAACAACTAATATADAAKRAPKLATLKTPATVQAGRSMTITGRIAGPSGGLSVRLESQAGRKWVKRASARVAEQGRFTLRWTDQRAGSVSLRVTLWRGQRRLAVSTARRVRVVAAGTHGLPTAPNQPATTSPPGTTPAPAPGATPDPAPPAVESVSYTPKAGTSVLSGGQLKEARDGELVLAAGAPRPQPRSYVYGAVTPKSGAYLVRVTQVSEQPDGTAVVTGTDAPLADAFAEYKVSYEGPLSTLGTTAKTRMFGRALGATTKLAFKTDAWECSASSGIPSDLIPDVDLDFGDPTVNFDVDVAERSIDFFLKGSLSVRVAMALDEKLSCSAKTPKTPEFPLGTTGLVLQFQGKATLDFKVAAPDGGRHNMVATSTVRVATGYSVIGGETSKLGAGSVDGSLQADGVSASLSLGLAASVGPPSLSAPAFDLFEAQVSAEFGPRLTVERPAENEYGELKGPNCFDANARLYLKVGANVTIAFWSAGVSHDFETPPVAIYRGPCWGYAGSATYSVTGRAAPGSYSCTLWNGCPGYDWNSGATLSMVTTTPARFNGSEVRQPHVWSAYDRNVELAEFEPNTCVVGAVNGLGTGSDDGKIPFMVFHSEGVSVFGSWGPLRGTSWHNDTYPVTCGGQRIDGEDGGSVSLGWYYPWSSQKHWNRVFSGQPSWPENRPAITGTAVGSAGGDSVATVSYNLTRIEIPRPSVLG